jgi:hypothetical protein
MYKLCDTCFDIEVENGSLKTKNQEQWNLFPHHLPMLGRREGSQESKIQMGKKYANRLLYYWGSKEMFSNKNLEFPDSYVVNQFDKRTGITNDGLVKLDSNGSSVIKLDCPQPYKEDGISYMPHFHFLISDKSMSKWSNDMFTQSVLCNIKKRQVKDHLDKKNRLIINALSSGYHKKAKIDSSFNLFYKDAQKMTSQKLKKQIKSFVMQDPDIQKFIKKNKLKLTEVPILVYCYDKTCNAGNDLALELFKAGFVNILDYKDGIIGWYNRY